LRAVWKTKVFAWSTDRTANCTGKAKLKGNTKCQTHPRQNRRTRNWKQASGNTGGAAGPGAPTATGGLGSSEEAALDNASPDKNSPEQDSLDPDSEEYWYAHVYQGDKVPQLTLRAVLMGGFLGSLMCLSNLYTIIKWAGPLELPSPPACSLL